MPISLLRVVILVPLMGNAVVRGAIMGATIMEAPLPCLVASISSHPFLPTTRSLIIIVAPATYGAATSSPVGSTGKIVVWRYRVCC